jgi:biotin operon repressor
MKGFVIIHRDILDWEWYQHPTVSRLFIHLILRANYNDKSWQGVPVRKGQLITSTKHLAQELNLSFQQIRTAIKKLITSGYITTRTTNHYTVVTIVNYIERQTEYKTVNKQPTLQTTKKEHSTNKRVTTTKQKNKRSNKTIEERKEDFKEKISSHTNYSKDILNAFFEYWSETNMEKSLMKFEENPFFEIQNRLKSWARKDNVWASNKIIKNDSPLDMNR